MPSSVLARVAHRALALTVVASATLGAQTYGHSIVARNIIDVFQQYTTFALGAPFLPTGPGTLSTFSVFGGPTSPPGGGNNVGRSLTPLLARNIGGVWRVTGTGASRTVQAGVNSWDFALTSGSAAVDADVRFGWWSGGSGAVHYSEGGPLMAFSSNGQFPTLPGVGTQVPLGGLGFARTYSISFTVGPNTTVVPEPSTYLLMATGLAGLAVVRGRRRTRAS
jgi:hypothetical protein